jgi:acetate kinase
VFAENIADHRVGIKRVLELLTDQEFGAIASLTELEAVGHRVVHAGEDFSGSVNISPSVIKALKENISLAPLHNPPNILGIEAISDILPTIPQVGVFDTAFHQSIPQYAFLYALPFSYYSNMKVRKYGFHGTSHRYVSTRAAIMLGKELSSLKLISCHLGNGSSVAAIKYGKSIDTSLGLTPNEGLIMGTRSGDIDVGAVFHIMKNQSLDIDEMNQVLNKKSGVLGISEISSDMRELEEAAENGDERAILTLDMYIYRLLKYIGAYTFALEGVDAVIFTGGVGENSSYVRERIMKKMEFLGLEADYAKNLKTRGIETSISKENSEINILVIPTNEELVIAEDTYQLVK